MEEARGGARPRPGPSEPPTSPCNFLACRSGKVGLCQLSAGAQTGNGLASSLPPLPPLLLWARHRLSIGILSPQAPSGRARRPPAAPSPGGPSLPEPSPLAPGRGPPPPAPPPKSRRAARANTCRGSISPTLLSSSSPKELREETVMEEAAG